MSGRGWRDDNGRGERGTTGEAARSGGPGKRTLVELSDEVASMSPGKRSLTQVMRAGQEPGSGPATPTMGQVAQDTIDRKGSGQPVDAGVRKLVEPQLGVGLGDVQVHTDERAAAGAAGIGARA